MTTKNFSMMIIGMMMLGTVNTFGKGTNNEPRNNRNDDRIEMRVDNNRGMGNNDMRYGNNSRYDDRTYRMERNDHMDRRDNRHFQESRHDVRRHHDNTTSKVMTGVIIGSVVTGIISSLVR